MDKRFETAKAKYEGLIYETNEGHTIKILEYLGANKARIIFLDEFQHERTALISQIKKKSIKNPYHRGTVGVGYIGVGKYGTTVENSNKNNLCHIKWYGMLSRCYDEEYKSKHKTYENASVCEEWHNFQNFAKWFYENYYKVENEIMDLDKDILIKGNKTYSPETCVIIPQVINKLFMESTNYVEDLPKGLTRHKGTGGVRAQCNNPITRKRERKLFSKKTELENIKEAKEWHNKTKRKVVLEVADYYADKVPIKVINAILSYNFD